MASFPLPTPASLAGCEGDLWLHHSQQTPAGAALEGLQGQAGGYGRVTRVPRGAEQCQEYLPE